MLHASLARSPSILRAPLWLAVLAPLAAAQSGDWVIPAGQTVRYRTSAAKVVVQSLRIEAGATLRIVGEHPFHVVADTIEIDGALDASGFDAKAVLTLDTGMLVEPGANGAAGGGRGGASNLVTTTSTPQGEPGYGIYSGVAGNGGGGGESGYDTTASSNVDKRRAAGGGGGAFGPDVPGATLASGLGLLASAGGNGGPQATSGVSGLLGPKGGKIATRPFVDADPLNDFFGQKLVFLGLPLKQGELAYPRPGVGGGAGGNACAGPAFPTPNWTFASDEKGCAGGGGGGLVIAESRLLRIGAAGQVRVNGGKGAEGENTLGLNHVGGASGGGSGGMILLQARTLDLSAASAAALQARGGKGGVGKSPDPLSNGAGGYGGPGLVQVHALDAQHVLVPAAYASPELALQVLGSPAAHVLLPVSLL